jgi:hypothetical protein
LFISFSEKGVRVRSEYVAGGKEERIRERKKEEEEKEREGRRKGERKKSGVEWEGFGKSKEE